jgi:hypothetical protein
MRGNVRQHLAAFLNGLSRDDSRDPISSAFTHGGGSSVIFDYGVDAGRERLRRTRCGLVADWNRIRRTRQSTFETTPYARKNVDLRRVFYTLSTFVLC